MSLHQISCGYRRPMAFGDHKVSFKECMRSRWRYDARNVRKRVVVSYSSRVVVEHLDDGSVMYCFGVDAAEAIGQGDAVETVDTPPQRATGKKISEMKSSWGAKEATGGSSKDADYLYELGQSDVSMNVDTAQNSQNLDSIFTGSFLGHQSDIADGTLRGYEFRSYNNIVGDYYVAPKFLDAVVMHIVKNYLIDAGCFDPMTKVPLILGIWGGKGQGKSFQTELAFKKLGVEAVVMSAGELESERAGEPGYMIRDRYRKAAEMSRVRGKLSCLLINDIDAGLGIFDNTQITVNNQMVTGTLMSICDNPNKVNRYNVDWREDEPPLQRIPVIVTGNDLSTVFAPLLRDGRMEKFYWQPSLDDLTNIIFQMYKDDGLEKKDMVELLKAFPNQSLDFYGALRAATYDNQIREWIQNDVIDGCISEENENLKELGRRLVHQENLPEFEPVNLKLENLMAEGERLVREQDHLNSLKLSNEYLKQQKKIGKSIIGLSG
ncbi:hypothetical protein M9435_004498 [Picochlorum sp. BPE23]|nr:hypothetical protein M9435_004498 [Picochlorum sp. BPE23]